MESVKQHIDLTKLPQHVAIIMDGNGRWAKQRGKERVFGHVQGVESVRQISEAATELHIPYLTLYTFSTENWKRPKAEVDSLMNLLVENLVAELPTFNKQDIRLRAIGNLAMLPEKARTQLNHCLQETAHHKGLNLILALSYSSQEELTYAIKTIATEVKDGQLSVDDITATTIEQHLYTADIPSPDLLIRTGGECRISNFLLWQLAYTELLFTPTYWPDFDKEAFYQTIVDYQQRERRFGQTSEQLCAK
ncbi:MAG: isoprenyl transferase [Bacteroidales bacterium]|nr:isoprenyl transferase [Bacteroidales bacterium]